ncbi:MAG: adenosylcobinamide-GDP ribazoletransferase [Pseudomonadota bacterium]
MTHDPTPDPNLWRPQISDIGFATGLLTRLPIRVNGDAALARGAGAAWAYGVVGMMLGAGFWISVGILTGLGVAPLAAVLTSLALVAVTTGAMHFDGLADVLDGFWGGWTKSRRLEIMKDSQLGVYGTVGLVLVLALQTTLWAQVHTNLWTVMALFSFSRALMLVPMAFVPHARSQGLSHAVGTPTRATAIVGLGIGGGVMLIVSVPAFAVMVASAISICWIAHRKIGGQTGDVLGATQVLTETAGLLVIAASLPH